jgi:hypothetical protein
MSHDEQVEWHLGNMQVSAGPGDAAAAFRMFCESDVRHVLGTIRVPALVLSRGGEQVEEGAAFARLIPGARHEAMPGAAFNVISEHADAYLEAIERFVVELRDEEAPLESILATVLFTDIVGSTARQAELGDVAWHELIHEHLRLIRGCLARYRGRELDTAGDGFFAAFAGPSGQFAAPARSARRSPGSGSSCARGSIPTSAVRSTGRSAGWPSRSARP